MRTTITVDDEKIERAKIMTGIEDTASLMRAALDALIQKEGARQMLQAGGTLPGIAGVPRNRLDEDDLFDQAV